MSNTNLKKITFQGDSVCESIGSYAFYGCTGLEGIYINNIRVWLGIEFEDSESNPLIYAKNLYINNELLTELVIPDNVVQIVPFAFRNCNSLTSVSIPVSVTTIGRGAFYDCTGLTEINYNATACGDLVSSYNYVFYNAGQSGNGITVNIGANVTRIPANLFYPYSGSSNSPKITSIVFEAGSVCTSIGNSAFYNCSSLTSVYYLGTSAEWNSITIGSNNTPLSGASIYCITFDSNNKIGITDKDTNPVTSGFSVAYSSEDANVATVDSEGAVTFVGGVEVGTEVTITATITFTNGDEVTTSYVATKA